MCLGVPGKVVAVNGLFGQRMVDVASRCGASVVPVEHEWGQPVDAARVLRHRY